MTAIKRIKHIGYIFKLTRTIVLGLVFLAVNSCIEEFEPKSITFESILVVEGTLTDEVKRQRVLLSRTTPIENDSLNPETGAIVKIFDSNQREYEFVEVEDGTYESIETFAASSGVEYQLNITTENGENYQSDSRGLVAKGQLQEIRAQRVINENGTDGVEILADASGDGEGPFFFRFEYEQTYQIIAPFAVSRLDLVVVSENPQVIDTIPKLQEERVCYSTDLSSSIVLSGTTNLTGTTITNIPIHFIPSTNPILRFRYSILVKQIIQSREAQVFYETLSTISDLDNLFAQIQPGFLEGNISSLSNPDQRVLGFFEVASVSSQRIFFNFRDVFTDIDFPPYYEDCVFVTFPIPVVGEQFENLKELLDDGFRLVEIGEDFFGEQSTYTVVSPACGNCNVLGTNIEPDFWVE